MLVKYYTKTHNNLPVENFGQIAAVDTVDEWSEHWWTRMTGSEKGPQPPGGAVWLEKPGSGHAGGWGASGHTPCLHLHTHSRCWTARQKIDITGNALYSMEGNVLFNDTLNTFYLRLYGIWHMVKDPSDSERGNLSHGLLFSINSNGSFICTIPQTG